MPDYTLGPLPWNEDILRRAYFLNFRETYKAIQEHPGYAAHRDLLTLQLSLEIFLDSVSDLFQSIHNFRIDAESPDFWNRPSLGRFNGLELAIRRGFFSAAASALALVDHSRIINGRVNISAYDSKRGEYFDEEEHHFIQSMRNYISHVRMIEADWQRTLYFSEGQSKTQFLLQRDKIDELLQWKKLKPQARAFIARHPKAIEIEELFKGYRDKVEKFHGWFHAEVAQASEPELSEYREYERTLKRFGSKSSWNLLLEIVIKGRLDPYTYLDRYLTRTELDEVFALPMRSRAQIDRIIELLDEYGACDEELKIRVYSAFGLDIPNNQAP